MRFRHRTDAGRRLAARLAGYAGRSDVIVLGLPRGGVPVAAEVAGALGAPLDIYLVRKLGVPGHEELAFGALAENGVRVLNDDIVAALGLTASTIDKAVERQRSEIDRQHRLYRGDRVRPDLEGRTVILVDDGLATGATMAAAVTALRQSRPARVIVAVPVGARETCDRLSGLADAVECLSMPEPFQAVGLWYEDFGATSDAKVQQLLASASASRPAAGGKDPDPPEGVLDVIRARAPRLTADASEDDALVGALGSARVVLLGEASHGTHEFYRQRALLTRRLIADHGFSAVAVEADWPDAYRVNRYVRGEGRDGDAVESLADFRRFPAWMWRNADVLDFVGWLRSFNESRPADRRAGFYGLDLYSLHASMRAVIAYLDRADPAAAAVARARYACFDRFGTEPQQYAYATGAGFTASCEREVVDQLVELRRRAAELASRDGRIAADEYFVAAQNARVVKNAEQYYRTMLAGRVDSWNLRDRHMTDTLAELIDFLAPVHGVPRVVVWAHNSHLGDARATDMGQAGELNVGQLVRARFEDRAVLVGFTSFQGTVTAAADWDGPALRRHLRPALPGSYERLLHETGLPRFVLPFRDDAGLRSALSAPRLERAVGVLYRPETERHSHYFHASLAAQFDYVLHLDETRAVEPLERTAEWEEGELAETYPSGL